MEEYVWAVYYNLYKFLAVDYLVSSDAAVLIGRDLTSEGAPVLLLN